MADISVKNRPFLAKDVKRSVMNGAKIFFDTWYLNNRFLRNCEPLKISLLHCYEVVWIHNIKAICIMLENCTIFARLRDFLVYATQPYPLRFG